MRAILFALMVALAARDVSAFAPATVRHRMSGRMVSVDRSAEVKLTFEVACIYYEEGPSCHGRFRCSPLARGGHEGDCVGAKGRILFSVYAMSPRDPYDPTWPTVADVYFDDDSSCRLDGTVPFKFGLEIPGLFGSYRCTNRAGDQVDSGSFGVRTTSVGRPFRRFD